MAVQSSLRPTWTTKLATRLSGTGSGRIGSAAGALGSGGTPTSMRGRFAKFGSQFGEEAGAQAALMPTVQAQQANSTGVLAQTQKDNTFDPVAYEAQQRKRRGLMPNKPAAPVVTKPAVPAPSTVPMADAQPAPAPTIPSIMPRTTTGSRVNMGSYQSGFSLPPGSRQLAPSYGPRV